MPRSKDGKPIAAPKASADAKRTEGEIARQAVSDFLREVASLPADLVAETLTNQTYAALNQEDRGWIRFGDLTGELVPLGRVETVRRARMYFQGDPMAKQAVRLWTDYAFGQGLSFKAKNPDVQRALERFWRDRRNRGVFRAIGQHLSSKKLLIDGELFLAVFATDTGPVVRRLDPLEIEMIYSDPNDQERPLFYQRTFTITQPLAMGVPRVLYYKDHLLLTQNDEIEPIPTIRDLEGKVINGREELGVWIYPLLLDAVVGQRGNSLLQPVLDWTKAHRRFMESRWSVAMAIQRYAQQIKATGGSGALSLIKNKFASGWNDGLGEIPQGKGEIPGGSTFLSTDKVTLENMPQESGATGARHDGDMFKLMVCAGTGIMLHYFGDPSTGNLATSKAMELPMLKMFANYQQLWADAFRDLFNLALDLLDVAPDEEDRQIDIDFPRILEADVAQLAAAVQAFSVAVPQLGSTEAVIQQILMALGINNIDQVMKDLLAQQQANREQPLPGTAPPELAQLRQAVEQLLESLRA
jgi:hypothetical protein